MAGKMEELGIKSNIFPAESFFTKLVLCLVAQLYPTLCDPMDCSLPGSSVHGVSPDKNTGVGCRALLHGSSQPRDQTQDICYYT